jgi:uncharacterized protein with HEPN domain
MRSEKESGALREILRNIELAEQFARGHTFETLQADEKTPYAVVRGLEIISEASRRVSDDAKSRHPLGFSRPIPLLRRGSPTRRLNLWNAFIWT